MRRWVCLLLLLVWLPTASCMRASQATVDERTEYSSQEVEADYGFSSYEELREHYSKHGNEFGSITQDEYLRRAKALRDAPVGGNVLQIIRSDGRRTRFDRDTGNFLVFVSDGTIITFFRPSDGERYFNRQATRPR